MTHLNRFSLVLLVLMKVVPNVYAVDVLCEKSIAVPRESSIVLPGDPIPAPPDYSRVPGRVHVTWMILGIEPNASAKPRILNWVNYSLYRTTQGSTVETPVFKLGREVKFGSAGYRYYEWPQGGVWRLELASTSTYIDISTEFMRLSPETSYTGHAHSRDPAFELADGTWAPSRGGYGNMIMDCRNISGVLPTPAPRR